MRILINNFIHLVMERNKSNKTKQYELSVTSVSSFIVKVNIVIHPDSVVVGINKSINFWNFEFIV